VRKIQNIAGALFVAASMTSLAQSNNSTIPNLKPRTSTAKEFNGWVTNGPVIYSTYRVTTSVTLTNSKGATIPVPGWRKPFISTNHIFDHFRPDSLNHLIWTNLLHLTNGRTIRVWSARGHPADWPAKAPTAEWATNGLLWGMRGMTALSPCWESEGGSGQVPITALTRRHGYTRGHSLGPEGFNTVFAGKQVWFFTAEDLVVRRTVVRNVGRMGIDGKRRDYTILLFNEDLPASIEPMRVTSLTNLTAKYPIPGWAPWPAFQTEQSGCVSVDLPGFRIDTWKGGDSGSPNMAPMPGELVFYSGRSTTGPDAGMQADMDELCRLEGLDPKRYQLQWVDLSSYPSY